MRTTVMEGNTADFDLPSVMQVVSIGRQYTGVELFDEQGTVVGTLLLKSGRILTAESGALSGLDAVTKLLRSKNQRRFAVYRTEPTIDVKSPVGSVGEVLLRLMRSEMAEPAEEAERVPVMEGSLTEFDLVTVLQVISIGRQFTGVEVAGASGSMLGRIELKAGRVISATKGPLSGIDAIRALIRSPRDSRFSVFRSHEEVTEVNLGPLAQILMKLVDTDEQWEATEASTAARKRAVDEPLAFRSTPPQAASIAPAASAESVAARVPAAPPVPAVPPVAPAPPAAARAPEVRAPVSPAHADAPPRAEKDGSVRRGGAEARAIPFVEELTSPHELKIVAPADREAPIICVTGPKGGAGKTTVTLNLGVALARQGRRVILIDGDVDGMLLALNAQAKSRGGVYDVVTGKARFSDVVIQTRVAGLRIVPTGDPSGPAGSPQGWTRLLDEARAEADVILVDAPAGVQGPWMDACSACTHTLIVLPADPAAIRGLPAHLKRLSALAGGRLKVVGVVLNMLDYRAQASLDVLKDLCAGPSGQWVFDIPIARSPAFMDAVARGMPVCRGQRAETSTIGWVFEVLASGVLERLGIADAEPEDAPLV